MRELKICIFSLAFLTACSMTPYLKPPVETSRINKGHAAHPVFPRYSKKVIFDRLQHQGVTIIKDKSRFHFLMPEDASFKSDSPVIQPRLMEILNYIAAYMDARPNTHAIVQGNADSLGTVKFNQALSERRAHAVIAYIESQGILVSRFETFGFSELNPIASNTTASGRLANRRIEITIIPNSWI